MDVEKVPGALRERLGAEATAGLLEVIESAGREWKADMISVAAERFERRLVEETSGLRVQGSQSESSLRLDVAKTEASLRHEIGDVASSLRQEITRVESSLRQEIGEVASSLRQEITKTESSLRQEITKTESSLRQEIADARFSLVKWSFAFWIGQIVTMTAIMSALLRATR